MILANWCGFTEELEKVITQQLMTVIWASLPAYKWNPCLPQPEGSGIASYDKGNEALEKGDSSSGKVAIPKPLDRKGWEEMAPW